MFRNIACYEIMHIDSSEIGDITKTVTLPKIVFHSFMVSLELTSWNFTVFFSILNYIQDILIKFLCCGQISQFLILRKRLLGQQICKLMPLSLPHVLILYMLHAYLSVCFITIYCKCVSTNKYCLLSKKIILSRYRYRTIETKAVVHTGCNMFLFSH